MDHEYYRDRVSAYHDRDLTPEEYQMMHDHLADCEECRELLARLEKLDALVDANADLGGDDYWEQSARKIEAKLGIGEEVPEAKTTDIRPKNRGLIWKFAAVAASIAALTFIAVHESDISEKAESPRLEDEKIAEEPQALVMDLEESDDYLAASPERVEETPVEPELEDAVEEAVETLTLSKVEESSDEMALADDKDDRIVGDIAEAEEATPEPPQTAAPAPQMAVNETEAVESSKAVKKMRGKSTSMSQPVESKPVTTVDELLKQVPGVVASDDSGAIFIRGGRAGEVEYVVDGVDLDDSIGWTAKESDSSDLSDTAILFGDVIPEMTSADSLAYLVKARAVRDSLIGGLSYYFKDLLAVQSSESKEFRLKSEAEVSIATDSLRGSGQLRRCLGALAGIAELTDDTEERQQCILLISRVATNETSPLQDHAKQLLTRLKK